MALNTPLRRLFDYLPNPELSYHSIQPGIRVKVPFGKRVLVGVVLDVGDQSTIETHKLKPIESVIDTVPLFSTELCTFFLKAAQYYHHPIGEVVFSGMPQSIKQGKPVLSCPADLPPPPLKPSELPLNKYQQDAIIAIKQESAHFSAFLLEGITGSGKTEVYLEMVLSMLQAGKQALILVPEISLTPQTLDRFQQRFGHLVVSFHSQVTPAKRRDAFLKIQQQTASVVVGTRSALFMPFKNLGLIIIDEEHDASFKQQEGFRYSARDLAVLRAKLLDIPIVLGSATPSFESLCNVEKGKYRYLQLPNRATNVALPKVDILDVRHNKLNAGLSAQLIHRIKIALEKKQQVLLFINRRGFAPVFMCYDCGWFAVCNRCETRLTFHLKKYRLVCHHCERVALKPECCPECKSPNVNTVGQGTEKIEATLGELFPDITMVRVDSDTTMQKENLTRFLEQARNNEAQLLIGTQILAKGHHFPHLALVAIIDADGGLFSLDFRAQERMAQLLIQVCGRAGRVHQAGEVVIQTFHPQHPFMQKIAKQHYQSLAQSLLQERNQAGLPPYAHFALIRANHVEPTLPMQFLEATQNHLQQKFSEPIISIKGPIPSPLPKKQGRYHFQLLLHTQNRSILHQALGYSTHFLETAKIGKKVRWSLDIDPVDMI